MEITSDQSPQLPHLDTFSVAAERCNFTEAAKTLGLTQASVSQRIQALELRLGKSLFDRKSGRVMLTQAGHKLYAYAQQILSLYREASAAVSSLESPLAGDLFIAGSSIPGEHLLPNLLVAFSRKYPKVKVHATVSDSMVAIEQVERGDVSLGFVGRRAKNPNLEFSFLASDRIILAVPARHPLSMKKCVSVAQFANHPLIVRESGSGLRHWFENSLDRAGHSLADLRVILELGSNEAIKAAVVNGHGIAVLSKRAVQRELESGELLALDIKGVQCVRELFVVHDRRRVTPLPARLFLSFLEANPLSELAA